MTTIPWLPSHAYLAGAVVTETTGLPLWRCTTAGTSGVVEPAWPTASPWTVADGATLVWTLNTTFREDVRAGIVTTLRAFQAANPDLVRQVWPVRAGSITLGDTPALVVGDLHETIATMQGVRQRTMDGFAVEVIDQAPDNLEASNRMDLLVDAVMDFLTAAYHSASGTSIVEPIGVEDGAASLGGEGQNLAYYGQTIRFRGYVMEGRT